jgi:putative addiction module component (TIGR02574 family)
MSALMERIERQAGKLSGEERERLAQRLLASLDSEPLTDVDEAWVREAERRYRNWKKGNVAALPARRVLSDIRKELSR